MKLNLGKYMTIFRELKIFNKVKSFQKIKKDIVEYDYFIREISKITFNSCFGSWVTNIWSHEKQIENELNTSNITFEDEKEIFFRTFQHLLEEGKIIVVKSNIDPKDPNVNIPIPTLDTFTKDPRYKYWNADAKYIVDHIRNTFPKDVKDYNDDGMNAWFYSYNEVGSACPWIGWVDQETGLVEAS